MSQNVLTVTQVNEYIRATLDADSLLASLAVKGEISNYKLYPSGHHYFTLKDDNTSLKCVMFRGNATRLRFRLENGMKIIVMGRIAVYPRDGAYQLYCTTITPDGVGDLHIAFEQLKTKLAAEGLFDPSVKKKIPQYPRTIGIITSSAGAAIHDILRILNRRYPLCKVRLFPVRVQGKEAPGEIVSAIRYANRYKLADLLIVGRGGGSIEDLWAFNDELVARAIFASEIPIISAVGHEPDVTIADFVADLRAATPSNGAELAVPDQDSIIQNIDTLHARAVNAIRRQLKINKQHYDMLAASRALKSPYEYIKIRKEKLDFLKSKLNASQQRTLHKGKQGFISLAAKLDALSPLKVLSRGYSLVRTADNDVVRTINQININDRIRVALNDGEIIATVTDIEGGL